MNWLDLVILIILVLGVLSGLRQGLGRMLARWAGLIVALIAAALSAQPIAAWADTQWGLIARSAALISRYVRLPRELAELELSPTSLAAFLEQLRPPPGEPDLVPVLEHFLSQNVAPALARGTATIGAFVHDGLARLLLVVSVFLVVFVVARWITAAAVASILSPLRLTGIDRVLGAALGGLERLVMLAIVLGILAPWLTMPVLTFMHTAVDGSRYAPMLMNIFLRYSPVFYRVIP